MATITYTNADLINIIPNPDGSPNFVQSSSGFDLSVSAFQDVSVKSDPDVACFADSRATNLIGANINYSGIPAGSIISSIRETFGFSHNIVANTQGAGNSGSILGFLSQGSYAIVGNLANQAFDLGLTDFFDQQFNAEDGVAANSLTASGTYDVTYTFPSPISKDAFTTIFASLIMAVEGLASAHCGALSIVGGETYGPSFAQTEISISGWTFVVTYTADPDPPDLELVGTLDSGVELDATVGESSIAVLGTLDLGVDISAGTIVISADVSGMYTLIPGQHFDRVYTRNVNPNDTVDVRIPIPFGKTAFLGS